MNRRIRELAIEADAWCDQNVKDDADYNAEWEHLKKFAELIVQECMEQVKGQYVPVLEDTEMMKDTHWDGYVQCGVGSVVAIKEHFGVE